jgi:hypothetical protein
MRHNRNRTLSARVLALGAVLVLVVPQAWSNPVDIVNTAAPKVGSAAPQAQDIQDGDVSVATSTGSLNYADEGWWGSSHGRRWNSNPPQRRWHHKNRPS